MDPLERVQPPAGGVPVVAALGRLTRQKGFDVLLEAVRQLVVDGVPVEVLLGGEGRERTALERRASGLPVRFPGFQADPRALLARADVFVLPSCVEALPLVLVKAVSAGLPAVATDIGDVRDALGEVVVVVPPDDPGALAAGLRRLLDDPADRARRGEAGARAARERLTARRMAAQAWEAFLPAADRPAAARRRRPRVEDGVRPGCEADGRCRLLVVGRQRPGERSRGAGRQPEVLERFHELVLKPRTGSGGRGVAVVPRLDAAARDRVRADVLADPASWVAQELVLLSTCPTAVGDGLEDRHVDLRPCVLSDGASVTVLMGGLTRVAPAWGSSS